MHESRERPNVRHTKNIKAQEISKKLIKSISYEVPAIKDSDKHLTLEPLPN